VQKPARPGRDGLRKALEKSKLRYVPFEETIDEN